MLTLSTCTRVTFGAALLLALSSACGGQSSKNGDDGPSAGSGGVNGRAGNSSGAGKSAQAGSSSYAGSGNTAGSPNPSDGCSGPATNGPNNCLAYFQRWTHDPGTGLCIPFGYGGCGATPNNYESLAACQAACPGGMPNYDACEVASDCVLAANGCCGVCDGPNVTAHDFRAYNLKYALEASACPSGDVACGACPNPEGDGAYKYFVPNCVNNECVVEDIRKSDVTACNSADDCVLRSGTGCCEGCGGPNDFVSVRNDGSLQELVCGAVQPPCDPCVAMPPSDARPHCNDDGHCGIVYLLK
ncbi:MAG TPA: BPTI/Kunitz-type proteinase inhibitor domain-containing protein [Polyangiaceae bacterium]|nr:BPTI/Kunitz-type proteinase inhibitor domain-containing protein [Polyangiaceae bacterium]